MQIFWGMEGGKPENPDRPDRCAHPEPCGEESGQLYCPETTKKEKYKEIYANFRGMEGGKPENPDRPDRCAHPEPCGGMAGNYIALKLPRKKTAEKEKERKQPRKKNTKEKYQERNIKKENGGKNAAERNKGVGTKEKGQRVPATQGVCRRCRRFGCREAAGAVRHGRV